MSAISNNIASIFDRRKIAFIALCNRYAERALQTFNAGQKNEFYWNNQTFQAKDSVFSGIIDESNFIGFFLAHGKDYGVYLELANDRKNEALRPVINLLWPHFIKEVKELYGAN